MPKFKIKLVETVYYTIEVEADDEETARADAVETWVQSDDPNLHFDGQGNGVEVYSTKEITS